VRSSHQKTERGVEGERGGERGERERERNKRVQINMFGK
jgi:hypothetical protein